MAEEKKEDSSKEEISEIFEIENGKENTIKTHTEIEKKEEKPSKKEIKKENNILKIVIFVIIGFVLTFLVIYGVMYYTSHFEVEGVKFDIVQVGQLTLYHTSLPVSYQGGLADYNFYLRTDPRVLQNLRFDDEITIKKDMVINMESDFNCNGNGVIAIANLLNLYKLIGTEVIKDENASCDEIFGRYMWINIREGDNTKVNEFGLNGGCYNIDINNCEILEGTEKFMLETFIEINKKLKE